jgi:16S rRNA processing protein RimM
MDMPHKNNHDAGSQIIGEPAFLVLGKLRRPHGVQGEIPLEVYTHLLELLVPESVVYVGEEHHPYKIERTRYKNELLLIKFYEINDRTLVSTLTNQLVYVATEQLPSLSEDEFYLHQLIGLHVYEEDGTSLGILTEILETGANDVYLIEDESGGEILIPATEEMILEIDIEKGEMIVGKMIWYGEGD